MKMDYLKIVNDLLKNEKLYEVDKNSIITTDVISNIKNEIKQHDEIILKRMDRILTENINEYNSKDTLGSIISMASYGVAISALMITVDNTSYGITCCIVILVVMMLGISWMGIKSKKGTIRKRKYVVIQMAIEELLKIRKNAGTSKNQN